MAQPIHIFQPPGPNYRTGGYLYNRRMTEQLAGAHLHTVTAARLPNALREHTGAHLLVDSLYIQSRTALEALRNAEAVPLIHGLASLLPGPSPRQRRMQWELELEFLEAGPRVVVTSEFMRSLLTARAPHLQVDACPPGVDDIFFRVIPQPRPTPPSVVTVANLVPNKGYLEHLAALSELAARAHYHWDIVGDASTAPAYAKRLSAGFSETGLADRVTLHGCLDRTAHASVLASATVHFFPSPFETYGMAVAESLAAGVPVVAPRVGELPVLVEDGLSGLLSPPSAPDALVSNLERVLCDATLRARLRAGAADRRASLPRWRDAALHLYNTLLVDERAS